MAVSEFEIIGLLKARRCFMRGRVKLHARRVRYPDFRTLS